jgi:hypothetical protein
VQLGMASSLRHIGAKTCVRILSRPSVVLYGGLISWSHKPPMPIPINVVNRCSIRQELPNDVDCGCRTPPTRRLGAASKSGRSTGVWDVRSLYPLPRDHWINLAPFAP